jgi:2-polyprenyl-3-methyl-5-hydroxy-6-metoxy-1,4-benzoquinol methylase
MTNQYDPDLFKALYFHSTQEAVMWHESLIHSSAPYQQMIEFVAPFISEKATIADFGCGHGALLDAAKVKLGEPGRLIGVDFNDRLSANGIDYISADLNNLDSLNDKSLFGQLDLAMASHVLEHLLDPVHFLRSIAEFLKAGGIVFIEVPDFSSPLTDEAVGFSNLVNLQHVHYFSLPLLQYAAHQAGYRVIKHQQILTGYIPRLQVLLQPGVSELAVPAEIDNNAAKAVLANMSGSTKKRRCLAELIIQTCAERGSAGLWGVGADTYLLMREQPQLAVLCQQGRLKLFDQQWVGHFLFDSEIQDSAEIAHFSGSVFVSPLLVETRYKMLCVAKRFGWQVRDPYMKVAT